MASRSRKQSAPAGAFGVAHPLFDRLLFVLAVVGVLVTVHLIIQQGRGFDRGCLGFSAPTGAPADCNAVVQSDAGKLLGVSNGVWGLLFYLAVGALGSGVLLGTGPVATLKKIRAGLIGVGLLYSLYLVSYQFSQVGTYCVLCLTSAAVVLLMFVTQAAEILQQRKESAMKTAPRTAFRDARLVAGLAVLALVLVGADVLYFNRLEVAAPDEQAIAEAQYTGPAGPAAPGQPAAPAECRYNPEKPPIPNYKEMVSFGDAVKGNAEAPVIVLEVFEPNCGHCKTAHPIIKEAAARFGEKAAFYFKPVIFWPQLSTMQVHALYAANQEGLFFEMLDRQFAAQNPRQGIQLAELRRMADAIGMNGEAMAERIESGTYNMMARQQTFQLTNTFNINSTPAVLINGRTLAPESRTVECIGRLIDEAAQQQ